MVEEEDGELNSDMEDCNTDDAEEESKEEKSGISEMPK